jgi:hypothetical protein
MGILTGEQKEFITKNIQISLPWLLLQLKPEYIVRRMTFQH